MNKKLKLPLTTGEIIKTTSNHINKKEQAVK